MDRLMNATTTPKQTAYKTAGRLPCLLLALLLLALPLRAPALEPHPVLSAALSMLEEGNPFIARYNGLTGSQVEARFPLGAPYFFGGLAEEKILRVMRPWQESRYYKMDRFYLYGLDCGGFTAWALKQAGRPRHPAIARLLSRDRVFDQNRLNLNGLPWEELPQHLQPGDLYALRHSLGRHIMLYIGTLKDFGYTEDSLPAALKPYLHYPLVAHASANPFYYRRYTRYIARHIKITPVTPPDGGVMVSLLGVPKDAAPYSLPNPALPGREPDSTSHYFLLSGYPLTVYDPSGALYAGWFRW